MKRRLPTINLALRGTCAWATTAAVALQSRHVFASGFHLLPLLLSMTVCAMLALLLIPRHWVVRCLTYAVLVCGMMAMAVAGNNGDLGADLQRSFVHGLGDALSAVWPTPVSASVVAAFTGICCLAALAAVDLATHFIAITGVLPSLGLLGLIALLAADAGPPSGWLLALYALTILALLRSQSSLRFSTSRVGLLVTVSLALASVPVLLTGLAKADRFDPRTAIEAPAVPDTGISPLARLDEWRTRTPANAVFTSTITTAQRWRLVGLTRYDGRTWMPAEDYRRSSPQINDVPSEVETVEGSVTIGDLDSFWYPTPQITARISLPVRIDGGHSGFLADQRPAPGTRYDLVVQPVEFTPAQLTGARAAVPVNPFVNGLELSQALKQLATTITAGAQTDYERAQRLATYLQTQYALDDASPAGHSLVVENLFLLTSRRGRDEQFVAAYGILAAAVGLPVRIAVGFQTEPTADGTATQALSSSATAWPEVEFQGLGWVPFDPIPTGTGAPSLSQGQGGIAPIEDDASVPPPSTTPAPPDSIPLDRSTDTPEVLGAPDGGLSTGAAVITVGLALLVLAPIAYAVAVLLLKRRRRASRAAAPDPRDRAIGAFRSGIDVIVDLGTRAPASMTDRELVRLGASTVGDAASHLEPMARLATEAVFRPQQLSGSSAKSWQQLGEFERQSAVQVGTVKFWRARLSLRSLRRNLGDEPQRVEVTNVAD